MTPILLLGEAKGTNEERINSCFVGPSGIELLRQLDETSIITLTVEDRALISRFYNNGDQTALDQVWHNHRDVVHRTNVLQLHPHANDLKHVCGGKAEGVPGYPPLIKSGYLLAKYEPELQRLTDEILSHDPNLIIALGNTALWALTGKTGVSKLRGTTLLSTHTVADFKLLPTYHPSAVLRQWELRPTTLMDLIKAKRESTFQDIRRPDCEIWIEPTIEDIQRFITEHIYVPNPPLLSVDIETSGVRVTCIGFGTRGDLAIVIPFDDSRKPDGNYWPTAKLERQCWEIIRGVLEDGTIPKLFQNGVYDINFLYRSYGIRTFGAKEDTMLLHHARQPESLKGLGYLGSVYTDHGSWKHMRKESDTLKSNA